MLLDYRLVYVVNNKREIRVEVGQRYQIVICSDLPVRLLSATAIIVNRVTARPR